MIIRSLARVLSPGARGARLSILIFHRVLALPDPLFPELPDVRHFARLMGWVQRWFQVLPLATAVQQLAAGTLPARALAITFDDGYADNASQALPVLQHYGLCATCFVASGYLDGGRMWNDSVIESVRRTRHLQLDLREAQLGTFNLRTQAQRRHAIDTLLKAIKYLPGKVRLQAVDQVVQAADVLLPRRLMLHSEQLPLLQASGMHIGAHTVSHPILAQCDAAQAGWEIAHSKRMLEDRLGGEPVTLFAYPNGKPGTDFYASHVAMARAAGFTAAVSTAPGAAAVGSDLLQLPRYTPWERGGLRFGLRMVGNLRRGSGGA